MNYVYIKGQKIYVDDEIYKSLKKIKNRREYIARRERDIGLIYISSYDKENFNALDSIKDKGVDVYKEVENLFLKEKLNSAVNKLLPLERQIIYEIYFENKTLVKISKEENINVMAVKRRKERALKHLKELVLDDLENYII